MINGFNYGIVREGRIAVVIMEALVTRIPYTLLRIHYSLLHTRLYLRIYTVFVFNSHRSQSSWNPLKAFLRAITSPRSVKRKQKKKKKKNEEEKEEEKHCTRSSSFHNGAINRSATISTIFSFYNNAFYFTCSSNLRRMKNDKKIVYERSKASCKYFSKSTLYTFQRPPCRLS